MGTKFISTRFYDQHSGFIAKILVLLPTFRFYDKHSGFLTNYIINHLPAANRCPILTVTM